jgi:hypothetical protein
MEHPAFVDLLTHTWDMLADIATTKTASRTITFATVDTNDQPQACVVVLRSVDPEHQILQFHTDADSLKCRSLRHNPKAQILVWNETVSIQLRLSVEVNLRQDAKSQALWQQVPSPSQVAYGKHPAAGAVISGPFDYRILSSQDKFVVVECHVTKIDYLSLKAEHFRAVFEKDDSWSGKWISP